MPGVSSAGDSPVIDEYDSRLAHVILAHVGQCEGEVAQLTSVALNTMLGAKITHAPEEKGGRIDLAASTIRLLRQAGLSRRRDKSSSSGLLSGGASDRRYA
jgi:nitrate reductase alpha subunit